MPNQGDNPDVELKAGHPPAVKVGSMRVTQRTHSVSSTASDKHEDHEQKAGGDGSVPSACSFAPQTVVDKQAANSGVPEQVVRKNSLNQEAVKHIHDKQNVKHDTHAHNTKPNMMIQQPKK